jgi:serine O-acetyltransferase
MKQGESNRLCQEKLFFVLYSTAHVEDDAVTSNQTQFAQLVDSLSSFENTLLYRSEEEKCALDLPSRREVIDIVEALRSVLFPGYFGISELSSDSLHFHIGQILDATRKRLVEQIRRGLCFDCRTTGPTNDCTQRAQDITMRFLQELPNIRKLLLTDAQASYEGDPAALSPAETIFCYPGIRAVTNYRLAHALHVLNVPLLPRMITEHAHSRTGIDIHPGARIGSHFFIDHGTGVVIGETCVLGSHVRLYQGVTLGAKSFPLDENGKPIKGIPRHPILEDGVVVYSGATILGRVTIGANSVVGGNVWLTESVPPGSKVSQPQPQTNVVTKEK